MYYTKEQIDRINSSKLAEQGNLYYQDNGLVWIGLYSKSLQLFSGNPALPVGASTDTTLAERTTPLDTQPISSVDLGVKADISATTDTGTFSLISLFKRLLEKFTTLNAKDFSTRANQDLQLTQETLFNTNINNLLNRNNGTFDAFYRQRFSTPETIFDSKQLSDTQSLFWDDQQISGASTTTTYNTNQASTTIAVLNVAGRRVRQTFRRFNYQPGKSQLFMQTGIFGTAATGIKRKIGLFDDKNGLFFDQLSTGMAVTVRTYTSGSAVDTRIAQADWNIDKMDGTGASGITLDWSKCQIIFGDYEWLGVGTSRFGVFIGGRPYYVHEINNANNSTLVYMSVPNLPLRYEIENDGTGGASNLTHICSTVIAEGGLKDTGFPFAIDRGSTALTTNNNASIYPLLGLRLKSTYLSSFIKLLDLSITCTSTATYNYVILLNPTIVGTSLTWSDITNSSCQQMNTSTNATTVTGGTKLYSKSAQQGNAGGSDAGVLTTDFALGSTIAGVSDIVLLCVQRTSGTSETFFGSINFKDQQ